MSVGGAVGFSVVRWEMVLWIFLSVFGRFVGVVPIHGSWCVGCLF